MLFVRNSVPESPRWLAHAGASTKRARSSSKLFDQERIAPKRSAASRRGAPRADELSRADRGALAETPARLLFSFVLNLAQVMPYYGILAIGGIAIFPAVGITGKAIPLLYLVSAGTGFCGQVVMAYLIDTWGRRPTLFAGVRRRRGCSALCSRSRTAPPTFVVVFLIFGMFSASCGAGAYVVISEIFPTELRATGIGLSVAVGRLGAIVAPLALLLLSTRPSASARSSRR